MIELKNVSKTYKGADEPAVKNINLNINKQEVFGLLGINGAGKTTLFSMLCGLFLPSEGEVFINQKPISKNQNNLKKIIGVVPQDIALYPSLTINENLTFFGKIYGIQSKKLKAEIIKYTNEFELYEKLNKKVKHLSGGMKRKLNLIAGILHNPEILLLDEPTVGIDAHSRKMIMDYLRNLNKNNKTTIIYTSHYLEEAEKICSKIAIIDKGQIIKYGNPKSLIKDKGFKNLEELFLSSVKFPWS